MYRAYIRKLSTIVFVTFFVLKIGYVDHRDPKETGLKWTETPKKRLLRDFPADSSRVPVLFRQMKIWEWHL